MIPQYCVYVHIYRNLLVDFFLREKWELWSKYTISCNLCKTGVAWMTEKQCSQISFWQWMSKCNTKVTIINQLCLSDYDWYLIIILCPIVHHLCMALSLVKCHIVKECWNVRHVSLLTHFLHFYSLKIWYRKDVRVYKNSYFLDVITVINDKLFYRSP